MRVRFAMIFLLAASTVFGQPGRPAKLPVSGVLPQ